MMKTKNHIDALIKPKSPEPEPAHGLQDAAAGERVPPPADEPEENRDHQPPVLRTADVTHDLYPLALRPAGRPAVHHNAEKREREGWIPRWSNWLIIT